MDLSTFPTLEQTSPPPSDPIEFFRLITDVESGAWPYEGTTLFDLNKLRKEISTTDNPGRNLLEKYFNKAIDHKIGILINTRDYAQSVALFEGIVAIVADRDKLYV
tara:strand:+ start:183 stop:500 length:318 start_codon:yes stop_codon:yes gene_type:complete